MLLVAVLFSTGTGYAEESDGAPAEATTAPAPGEALPTPPPPPSDAEKTPAAEEERNGPRLTWSGRIFARATADERDDYARELSIPSARIDLEAEYGNVEAKIEADVAERSILRDAFLRVQDDAKRFRLQGGRFKAPFLGRELESRWDLPLIERGLVDDYLVEEHSLGGRRLGLMAEGRFKSILGLRAELGVFQGGYDQDLRRNLSEDVSARVSVRPWKLLRIGASTYVAEAFEKASRFAVAGEATLRFAGLEVTGEATSGRLVIGPFQSATVLARYDLPIDAAGRWLLQPVLSGEVLRLLGETRGQGWAGVGGVNVVFDDRLKLMIQGERAFRPGDDRPRNTASLQLAAQF